MKALWYVWALALIFQSPAALATTYYVSGAGRDTNAGTSSAAPFLTITKAANLTKPGDIVYLLNGTYAPLTITHSGAEAAWITYKGYPGQHPIVRKDGTAWNGIFIEANYIVVSGLTVQGNAQSITIAQATAASSYNNTTNGHCIEGGKTRHHIKILNNTLAYCPGAGVAYWGDYGWIEHNTIHHNTYWSHLAESGIVIVGTNTVSPPGKIYIDGNLVYNNQTFVCNSAILRSCLITDGNGIIVDSNIAKSPPSGYSGRIEIFNNIVYNNGGWGIVDFASQHVDIYNNTTWHNGLSVFDPIYVATGGEIGLNKATDVVVENNIFLASTGGVILSNGFPTITNYIWDYNVMYNMVAGTRGSTPIGAHDLVLNPMFTTWLMPPQAFGLQEGSAGIGAGTPTLMPPTDYNGNARFAARVDCGAYTGWN